MTDILAGWNTDCDRDTAVLLVSELVSNAVVHAGSDISVTVRYDDPLITIEVKDGSDQIPIWSDVPATATSGRGLHMVDLMADDWGVRSVPGAGKITWFTLATERVEPLSERPRPPRTVAMGPRDP